jgi:hypothetical protein
MKRVDQGIDWRQEYEILRQEALDAGARRGHGLALFLSRGMRAWLEALTALQPRPVVQSAHEESGGLPSILWPDLTTLLASMVLSCMRRETYERAV